MTSNPNRTCRHHSLAQGPVAQVQLCQDCGCVSMHLGATTVRMDPEALHSVWRTLGEAVAHLGRERMALEQPPVNVPRGDA
jgi:hypothetical protein